MAKKNKSDATESADANQTGATPADVKMQTQGLSMSGSYDKSTHINLMFDFWLLTFAAVGWPLAFIFGLVSNDYSAVFSLLGALALIAAIISLYLNIHATSQLDCKKVEFFVMNSHYENDNRDERVKFDVANDSYQDRLNRTSQVFNASIGASLTLLSAVLGIAFFTNVV